MEKNIVSESVDVPKSSALKYLGLFFVVLILIGTFFDQQIAEMAYGHGKVFAKFFEIFGEAPVFIGLILALAYFARMADRSKVLGKIQLVVNGILGYALSFGYSLILISYSKSEFGEGSNGAIGGSDYIIAVFIAIAIFGVILYLLNRYTKDQLARFKSVMILLIILFFVENLGVQLIKYVWGRPRFWSVHSGVNEFVPWYHINGPAASNEFRSFISGHTANSFVMIALYIFPKAENQALRNKLLVFAITWGCLTGLSRVLLGQHYLTDVTFGGVFTILAFFGLKKLLKIK